MFSSSSSPPTSFTSSPGPTKKGGLTPAEELAAARKARGVAERTFADAQKEGKAAGHPAKGTEKEEVATARAALKIAQERVGEANRAVGTAKRKSEHGK